MFAVFSTAWVVPGVIGPASSSAIESALSWRAVFLALLPFVVLAGVVTIPVLTRAPAAVAGEPLEWGPDRRCPGTHRRVHRYCCSRGRETSVLPAKVRPQRASCAIVVTSAQKDL